MVVIAGPVFPEWYWGPIFFLIFYSPLIAVVGVALFLLSRRWRRPSPAWRVARIAGSLLGAIVLVLAGSLGWRHVQFERAEARDAATIAFATFEPRDGAGFRATRAEVHASSFRASVQWTYERGGATVFVTQGRPREADLVPPDCGVSDGGRFGALRGGCELRRTASGRDVLLVREDGLHALASLDGTLVVAHSASAPEEDLVAYVDALEPVTPSDIDFKR